MSASVTSLSCSGYIHDIHWIGFARQFQSHEKKKNAVDKFKPYFGLFFLGNVFCFRKIPT